jgi:hypothetical protein
VRTWERTRIVEPCGGCNARLEEGTPIQVVTLVGLPRRIRCRGCADGPVDDEQLEAFDVAEDGRTVTKAATPAPMAIPGATRPLFDPRKLAAGDND